jgi:hypothetical protein
MYPIGAQRLSQRTREGVRGGLNLEASEVLVLTNRPESERLVLADE